MPPNVGITTTPTTSGKPRGKKENLHYLAASSSTTSVDAARAILERGANVSAIDRDGATPLHYACVHDNVAMVQLLLTFGADPATADKLGRTPYSVAKGNSLRFLRRYRKKDIQQRQGIFRRFFACHSRNDTFFVVRHQNPKMNPTALADAASVSFQRGNALTKSYRTAKKKIRATIHAMRRSSSQLPESLEDVVLTSEGLRTVTTPSRAKRSVSVADLAVIPDSRTIREEDRKTGNERRPRRAARTPEAVRVTPKVTRRSKSQETTTRLVAMPSKSPMAYYQSARAKQAGLRPAPPVPSAPPLSPDPPKTPKTPKARSKSPANTTAYFTADDDSIELIGNDFEKLKIVNTPKNVQKEEPDEDVVITPTTVDDGEMRKIKRLRDNELKSELKKFGISPAGGLDPRTRRLYEKKLLSERRKITDRGYAVDADEKSSKYSPQLERVLNSATLPPILAARAAKCDEMVRTEFEGNGYSAFCYLIMDPRILGSCVDSITFSKFVESIFYVGKGSKNRPLAHFIDARNERREQSQKLKTNDKLRTIDELWTLGHGIPRHEIAHGVSDEEAFVREASIIEAIKIANLSNKKGGEFHGSAKHWDNITKAEYGTFLLHKALATLKIEGIRLITEEKLPESIYPYVTNRRGAGAAGVRTPKTPK